MKAYIVTLGCPKNLVDSEASMAILGAEGCEITDDPHEADVLIVSACSFLDMAWQETVEEARRLADIKAGAAGKKLVMMGCLPRHRTGNLEIELPWIDHFIPNGAHDQLATLVRGRQEPDSSADRDGFAGYERRPRLTLPHTAYVKIAEGCSRRCSFCAIPKIRGRMTSRDPASIVRELDYMVATGVKEVSLLAQDITSYRVGDVRFPDLVDQIAGTGIDWIRIYYVHPGSLTRDLARRLFAHPAVCRYLECPVQHASDAVLRRMRRPYTADRLRRLLGGIREDYPDVRIRSEVIVGFPGETDEDFDSLKRFVEEARFSSLGIFTYSPEHNTAAAQLDGAVPADVCAARATELEDLQQSVMLSSHAEAHGRVHRILVDREIARADRDADGCTHAGRYYGQALEVDGEVLLRGGDWTVGEFSEARIVDSGVYDLTGESVDP